MELNTGTPFSAHLCLHPHPSIFGSVHMIARPPYSCYGQHPGLYNDFPETSFERRGAGLQVQVKYRDRFFSERIFVALWREHA